MVADGQMEPVRLNGVVGSTDHTSYVVGVRVRRVKVCVVTDEHGHLKGDLRDKEHA